MRANRKPMTKHNGDLVVFGPMRFRAINIADVNRERRLTVLFDNVIGCEKHLCIGFHRSAQTIEIRTRTVVLPSLMYAWNWFCQLRMCLCCTVTCKSDRHLIKKNVRIRLRMGRIVDLFPSAVLQSFPIRSLFDRNTRRCVCESLYYKPPQTWSAKWCRKTGRKTGKKYERRKENKMCVIKYYWRRPVRRFIPIHVNAYMGKNKCGRGSVTSPSFFRRIYFRLFFFCHTHTLVRKS